MAKASQGTRALGRALGRAALVVGMGIGAGACGSADEASPPADDVRSGPAADASDAAAGPGSDAQADAEPTSRLPSTGLPFAFARVVDAESAGEPLTDAEVAAFTKAITGFWRESGYWRWVQLTSHGLDPSYASGELDYALWWQDTQASKSGDTVTFTHTGRADNLTLRTMKVLTNASAGLLGLLDPHADATPDDLAFAEATAEHWRWVTTQYSKGIAALSLAMDFSDDDPVRYLQARAVFTHNHAYDSVGGRKTVIDYDPVRRDEESWNAAIVPVPGNPHWAGGEVWMVNQRSKDDVPHMYRAVPMLERVAASEGLGDALKDAATLGLEYLRGFAQDVVDSGYQIRTKFADGEAVVPVKEDGVVKDLASLVLFDGIIPDGECPAKLGSALLAQGEALDHACGDGERYDYEDIATTTHYFNYAIVRLFHVSAAALAVLEGEHEAAAELLRGLGERADRMIDDPDMPNRDHKDFEPDTAVYLLTAASVGLPLTPREARLVVDHFTHSATHYGAFAHWDPWAEAELEGDFDYKPKRDDAEGRAAVRITEVGHLLEYCASEWRHPDTAALVDCEVVLDPSRWGK